MWLQKLEEVDEETGKVNPKWYSQNYKRFLDYNSKKL
jgi:hypothetical protein